MTTFLQQSESHTLWVAVAVPNCADGRGVVLMVSGRSHLHSIAGPAVLTAPSLVTLLVILPHVYATVFWFKTESSQSKKSYPRIGLLVSFGDVNRHF